MSATKGNMPPVLISSAAGKKAAPKGAVRRRPAAAPGSSAPSQTTPSVTTTVAPQSPPPIELPSQPTVVEEPAQGEGIESTEGILDPTAEPERDQTQTDPVVQSETSREAVPTHGVTANVEREAAVEVPADVQLESQPERNIPEHENAHDVPGEVISESVVESASSRTDPVQEPPQQQESQQQIENSTEPPQHVVQSTLAPPPAVSSKPFTKRPRNTASASSGPRPAKRAKRSFARSNAIVQAELQADDEVASSSATTPADAGEGSATPTPSDSQRPRRRQVPKKPTAQHKTRSKTKSAATATNSDDVEDAASSPESAEEGATSEEIAARKPKQRRRKKQVRIAENPEVGPEGPSGETNKGDADEQQESEGLDPELHEIDPNTMSMFDLTHETSYGKTSERGRKMAEIDWDEVVQKRRAEAAAIASEQQPGPAGEVVPTVEGPNGTTELQAGEAESAPTNQPAGASTGNEAFLVDADGNIVLDEATVRHDATAQAIQAAETGAVEDVNDLTTQLNRTTWINNNRRDPVDRVPLWKWKSDPWTEEETDRFYDALTMFGSDFFIISKMFPGKNRRMIKAKFNREEKLDAKRVDDALMGKSTTKTWDLEHYSRETGRDMSVFTRYDGLEHAQGIINESMKEKHEATIAAAQQEAALAEEKAQREKSEKREKSRTAKKARKQRAKAGGTLGGAPDED